MKRERAEEEREKTRLGRREEERMYALDFHGYKISGTPHPCQFYCF